jgi:hypothetical protein
MNQHGGIAGRRLVVDFIGSHLSQSEARNAVIQACKTDVALVGTAALFLNNVDDMVGCRDQAAQPTGLHDLAAVTTEVVEQCSPVTFPINPPRLICATRSDNPRPSRAPPGPSSTSSGTPRTCMAGSSTRTTCNPPPAPGS